MAHGSSTGYGSQVRGKWENLMFDGDSDHYEQWEIKFLAYMKLRKLKKTILPSEAIDNNKNEEAFSELVQFLDDTSLGLIIRDARDNGRKALEILREHYAGTGKPRIISLYTVLTLLQALKNAREVISDSLLIAMVMKGLPREYQSFVAVMAQQDKVLTFLEFKAALRSYEDTVKTSKINGGGDTNTIMKANSTYVKKIICYICEHSQQL